MADIEDARRCVREMEDAFAQIVYGFDILQYESDRMSGKDGVECQELMDCIGNAITPSLGDIREELQAIGKRLGSGKGK